MASRKQKGWTFVENKEPRKNKKSKNRKKERQRPNEFEIISGSSSDEQQFEVIPPTKVRALDLEPLRVTEDYYSPILNVEETDSDIEVISKDPSSNLCTDVLTKTALSTEQHGLVVIDSTPTDSDAIESGEDVLAMELDSLLRDEEDAKTSTLKEQQKEENEDQEDNDFGIEVIDEGSAIDVDLLKMEKNGFPQEAKIEKQREIAEKQEVEKQEAEKQEVEKQEVEKQEVEKQEVEKQEVEKQEVEKQEVESGNEEFEVVSDKTTTTKDEDEIDDSSLIELRKYLFDDSEDEIEDIEPSSVVKVAVEEDKKAAVADRSREEIQISDNKMTLSSYGLATLFERANKKTTTTSAPPPADDVMTSSSYCLASLFETTTDEVDDDDDDTDGDRNHKTTIKTTTLVLLLCVSIAAGMSVGTGLGSLITAVEQNHEAYDQHRNSLASKSDDDLEHIPIEDLIYDEDGEFKATEKTVKEILSAYRTLEIKYNSLKGGYDDYKRRYSLHKHMMWYWRKRAKKSEASSIITDTTESIKNVFEEDAPAHSSKVLLKDLKQALKTEKVNTDYWREKYTSLKLSKIRTCAKLGKEIPAPSGFSFSKCLVLLSNAIPELNITTTSLAVPVERLSDHVAQAWNNLKNKWKKNDFTLKDSAAVKKSLNVKRFRKMFSYGNIVADQQPELQNNNDGEVVVDAEEGTCGEERFEDFHERWRKPVRSFPKPGEGKTPSFPKPEQGKTKKTTDAEEDYDDFDDDDEEEEHIDLTHQRGSECTEDCFSEYTPRDSDMVDLTNERGDLKEGHRDIIGVVTKKRCDETESIYVHIEQRFIPCKKEKVDLARERGTPCDKDCMADTSVEKTLREEKERLQKKLNTTATLFEVYKVQAKSRLEQMKKEMKNKWELHRNRRTEHVLNLKRQKEELKSQIRQLKENEQSRYDVDIRELERINDQLKSKIDELTKEKRYWERIEKYNLQQKVDELKHSLVQQQHKYETQIKTLKTKFKMYVRKQKARENQNRKPTEAGKQGEKMDLLRLENSRLVKKLDFYKKKERTSNIKIDQLKALVQNAKRFNERKSKMARKLKKRSKANADKLDWKSYDGDLSELSLPWLPSVYCPDQLNCMKMEKDDEKKESTEDGTNDHWPGTLAIKPFEKDEDILHVTSFKLRPPLNLTPSYFPPKPSPPSGNFRPEKPIAPERLRETKEETHRSQFYTLNTPKEEEEEEEEKEDYEIPYHSLEDDHLQSWLTARADQRALSREENEAFDEIIEKDWYLSMMKLRESHREEIKQQDLEEEKKLNWYIKAMTDKDEERWHIKSKNDRGEEIWHVRSKHGHKKK